MSKLMYFKINHYCYTEIIHSGMVYKLIVTYFQFPAVVDDFLQRLNISTLDLDNITVAGTKNITIGSVI